MVVRDATPADAAACAAIYAPYVRDTAVSFEEEPPETREMARRMAAYAERHAWLVLEDGAGRVAGFAYGSPHRERAAYRWTCEVSAYLEAGRRRTGGGRALYDVLLPRLAQRGYRTALAGITLPNAASEGFHRAMGFEPVGVYRGVGHKFGAWHDVAWLQRPLGDPAAPVVEPGR